MKSIIADNIMRDYAKKKRYESNKRWAEMNKFKKETCAICANKNTDLCEIRRNEKGNLQCVNKNL